MDDATLEQVRLAEIESVIRELRQLAPPRARLLEIGGGSGWQAKRLAEVGYDVAAIDVAESHYLVKSVFPVAVYDGHRIPYPDDEFDVVFSSNVLEHIPHIDAFQHEMLRVLKPGGVGIHLLPTATWRIWTSLVHYPALAASLPRRLAGSGRQMMHDQPRDSHAAGAGTSLGNRLRRALLPARHGEFGNIVTEIYYFSRFRWDRTFAAAGWVIERRHTNRLFYTGYGLTGRWPGIGLRRRLHGALGSACHLYVLRKPTN